MDWRKKLLGERVISFIPGPAALTVHRKLQARYTRVHTENDQQRQHELSRGLSMCQYLHEKVGFDFEGARLLEVGTGWHGSDIVVFHLLGAEEIWTCDLLPHLKWDLVHWMAEGAADRTDEIAEKAGADPVAVAERSAALLRCDSLESFLEHTNIKYIAPCLFHQIDLPADHFDLFYSYSVLQRVPPKHLIEYLRIGNRALKPDRYALHVFHHGDHNARHDRNLNALSYLRYGAGYDLLQSKRFNYQNRIRHADFVALFEKAGMRTICEETTGEDPACLDGVKVAKRFRHLPLEDLLITRTQLLSQAT